MGEHDLDQRIRVQAQEQKLEGDEHDAGQRQAPGISACFQLEELTECNQLMMFATMIRKCA